MAGLSIARRVGLAGVAVVGLVLGGCSLITDSFVNNDFSGDAFPIQVNTQGGGVLVGARRAGAGDLVAVLDVLSPLTLVDPGPDVATSISSANLTVLGERTPGGPLDLPRALLRDARLIALHPCAEPTCAIGAPGALRDFDAIIGADVLAGDALRLRLGDDQVFVLADVGGRELDRSRACDGVFPSPYRGGGTLVIAGTELGFSGRRITIQACLGANPDPLIAQGQRGADALLVVSTGVGITILGETAYARYRQSDPAAPDVASLPDDTVLLPSGPVAGRRGSLSSLALVATSSTTPRAPCRQVYGSHLLLQRNCTVEDDCPCESGGEFCAVPAIVELHPPARLDVLVVSDANATLQALRAELRPDQAEVDGILGADALRTLELDADYPHSRVLVRCTGEGCVTRPGLTEVSDRTQIQGCLPDTPTGPIF